MIALLAPVIGARADQLEEAVQHEDYPRRLRRHLVALRAREHEHEQRDVDAVAVSTKEATALGAATIWRGEVAYLDVRLQLDPGLACAAVGYVRLVAEGYAVPFVRGALVALRRQHPRFAELGAHVDELGLRLRWRSERRRSSFEPQAIAGRREVLDMHLREGAFGESGAMLGARHSPVDAHGVAGVLSAWRAVRDRAESRARRAQLFVAPSRAVTPRAVRRDSERFRARGAPGRGALRTASRQIRSERVLLERPRVARTSAPAWVSAGSSVQRCALAENPCSLGA